MTASQPSLDDYLFDLPADAIAQRPAATRDGSRLLEVTESKSPSDHVFSDLPGLLRGDELLVLNDTRVVPARVRGHKPTGGAVELLVLGPPDAAGLIPVMARANKALRPGTVVQLGAGAAVVVAEACGGGHYRVRTEPAELDLNALLEAQGEVPLPPYIERAAGPDAADLERYQTVFAQAGGAVAAPTAGLHFTPELLDTLRARGHQVASVTLHVGPGTFLPVRTSDISTHQMHSERFVIPQATADAVASARAEGRPVLAIGTTTVRALEGSASRHGQVVAEEASTELFIRPGFVFRAVDQLLTNFHLPGSTLLMLVSALAGRETVLDAYRVAIERGYRFYSYGDAMLLR